MVLFFVTKSLVIQGEYEPTPAELRLLVVLEDLNNLGKSKTEISKLADISRNHYHRLMKKPEFTNLLNNSAIAKMRSRLAKVNESFIEKAEQGSFAHQKLLYEIVELYTPKQKIDIGITTTLESKKEKYEEYKKHMESMGKPVENIEFTVEEDIEDDESYDD